jgi:hypothetical protein
MAVEHAKERNPEAAENAETADRLFGIRRAARIEAAGAGKQGRDGRAVGADREKNQFFAQVVL